MKSFRYDTQTCIYYGRNCLKENADKLEEFGKKAVIVTSRFVERLQEYCPGRSERGL
mgnify:FL=1